MLEVGSILARVGARFDDSGFDRFDRRYEATRRKARDGVEANLKADHDDRGFRRFNDSLNRTEGRARVSGKGIAASFGVASRAAGGAAVAGSAALGLLGKSAIGTASDIAESVSKNQVLFGKYAASVDRFAKDAANSIGISRKTALEATGTFGNLFTALDIGPKKSAQLSVALTKLAGDMASFNNATPEEALEAIRSGLVGETEPLRRFGVSLDDARLRMEAVELGLKRNTKEALDPHTKALAVNRAIFEDTTKAQGDYQRTSGSLSNQVKTLKANFSNLSAELGGKLAPTANRVVTFLNNLITGSSKSSGAVSGLRRTLAGVGGAFASVGRGIGRFVKDNRDLINGVGRNFRDAFNGIRRVVGGVAKVISDTFGGGSGFGQDLRAIGRLLLGMYRIWQDVMLGIMRRLIPPFLTVFRGLAQTIRGVVRIIGGIIRGDFGRIWAGMKDLVAGPVRVVLGVLRGMVAPFSGIFGKVGDVIKGAFLAPFKLVREAASGFVRFFLGITSGILKAAGTIVSAAARVPVVGKRFKGLANDLKEARKDIDRYRESLRGADKEAGRTAGLRTLKRELADARERLKGLRRGSKEYADTAEEVRKKQRQVNAAMRESRNAGRRGARGVGILGNTFRNLGEAASDTGVYIGETANRLLKDFGAKPLSHAIKRIASGARRAGEDAAAGAFAAGGTVGALPALVSSGELAITPDGRRITVPGRRTRADNVLAALPPGTAIVTDQGRALEVAGLPTGEILRRQVPHFAAGGMVRVPGDPNLTGGRDRVNAAIADEVASWIRRFKIEIGYAYDPGHHQSPGHNVTGTALDVVPGPGGSWDTVEAGLRAAIKAGKKVLYGSNGVGIPYANHGRGHHAHVEWGMGGAVAGAGVGGGGAIPHVPRIVVRGGTRTTRGILQGNADTLRRAANRYLDRQAPAASATGRHGSLAGFTGGGSAAENRALGKRMAEAYRGWGHGPQWAALDHLWGVDESGWNERADNPTSDAYGIPQALPGSKMGPGWQHDPAVQIRWGLGYIADRYGDPIRAHAFRHAKGWYRAGGLLPAFRGGGLVGATGTLTRAGRARRASWQGIVAGAEGRIGRLGKDYDLANRRFERVEEVFVNEGTSTSSTPTYNYAAIRQRASELEALVAIRAKLVTEYAKLERYLEKLIALYVAQEARLAKTIAGIRGRLARLKGRKGREATRSRAALTKRLGTYNETLGTVRNDLADVRTKEEDAHYEGLSAREDVLDLRSELQPLLATLGRGPGAPVPLPSSGEGGSGEGGAASAIDVAAEARRQLQAFQSSREELLRGFGSNYSPTGRAMFAAGDAAAMAAGYQFFGAYGGGPAYAPGGSKVPNITQNITFKGGASDERLFPHVAANEAKAANR